MMMTTTRTKRSASLRRVFLRVCAFLLSVEAGSYAALTGAETEQLRELLQRADASTVPRARAVAARPDLSSEETGVVFQKAFEPLSFTPQRAGYVRALVFGAGSLPSRPVLAPAALRGLLAHASFVFTKFGSELASREESVRELTFLYRFVAEAFGGADLPLPLKKELRDAFAMHVRTSSGFLSHDGEIPPVLVPMRAQAWLAVSELSKGGASERLDLADALSLLGERRAMLIEQGILLLDRGNASEARVRELRERAKEISGAPSSLFSVVVLPASQGEFSFVGKMPHRLLSGDPSLKSEWTHGPWGEHTEPLLFDAPRFEFVRELVRPLVHAAFADKPGKVQGLLLHLGLGKGSRVSGLSSEAAVEHALATLYAMLLEDGRRTLDMVLASSVSPEPQPLLLFGALLDWLAGDATAKRPRELSELSKDSTGRVVSFKWGEDVTLLERGDLGSVTRVLIAGALPDPAGLSFARPTIGERGFPEGWKRSSGDPRMGVLASKEGAKIRVLGGASRNWNTALGLPGDSVLCELSVPRGQASVVLAAKAGRKGVSGAGLLVTSGDPERLQLVRFDGEGPYEVLAQGQVAKKARHRVELSLSKGMLSAKVDEVSLRANTSVRGQAIALQVGPQGILDLSRFVTK